MINKALIDKILIPVIQTGILSIIASVSGYLVSLLSNQSNNLLWALCCGFVFASFWLIKSFSGAIAWRPQKKGIRAARQELLQKEIHKITAIAQDRQSGTFHNITIPIALVTRTCFHIAYMDGKFSYPYLVENQKILSKGEMKKLREEFLQQGFILKGRTVRSHCTITCTGNTVMHEYANRYKPNKEERKIMIAKARKAENEKLVLKANLQPNSNDNPIDKTKIKA